MGCSAVIAKGSLRYFGTDGLRGKVGEGYITPDFLLHLGWAAGLVLAKNVASPSVVIGRDTRRSGEMIQSALQAGLAAAGVTVLLAEVVPTPAVAYLTHSLRATAGMVISASHNPYYDNGVKFFNDQGMKLSDVAEQAIEAQVQLPLETVSADRMGDVFPLVGAKERYIEFCKSTFPSQLTLDGLKIVVDCAHGAMHEVAPTIFHELGAEVVMIGIEPSGFNINESCGATDTALLQQYVIKESADLGIAFDGDGDRLMMVDHEGERVDGDEILCILAHDRVTGMSARPGVVGTLMSNWGLEQSLAKNGIEFVRSAVGDRYVLEALQEKGWSLGGESSGHIVDLDYTTTGDGVISALQVLRVMLLSSQSLHVLKQRMIKTPQVLINVPMHADFDIDASTSIKEAVRHAEGQLQKQGRVLLRASGTQPYVRVMVEGFEATLIDRVAKELAAAVESSIQAMVN